MQFERRLAEEILRPAYQTVASYRAVAQSPQYTEEQRAALLQQLNDEFTTAVGATYRVTYRKLLGELSQGVIRASEITEFSARNLKNRELAGCMSRSCITLFKADLARMNAEIRGFGEKIDLRLSTEGVNLSYLLDSADANYGIAGITESYVVRESFPFDVDAKDFEVRAEADAEQFEHFRAAQNAAIAEAKKRYLRLARAAEIKAKRPHGRNVEYTYHWTGGYGAGQGMNLRFELYELKGCAEVLQKIEPAFAKLRSLSPRIWMDLPEFTGALRDGVADVAADVGQIIRREFPEDIAKGECIAHQSPRAAMGLIEYLKHPH